MRGGVMENDRRCGSEPVPSQLYESLNEVQRKLLPGIKCSGWELCFSRERLFLDPEIVIRNRYDNRLGVLEYDGSIRILANTKIRGGDEPTRLTQPDKPPVWTY
jgi:hypothetical protein